MGTHKNISFLGRKEIRELQNKKLRYFITRQIYPFSNFYRNLFDRHKINPRHIRTVDDLRLIPFTQKSDFLPARDNPGRFRDFILQPDASLIRKYCERPKLLKLAALKLFKGQGFIKGLLENEYKPIFLTATTGTTNNPVSFLYSNYDMENLRLNGYRLLDVFGINSDTRAVNIFPYAPHLAFWQTVFAGFSRNVFMLSTGGGKVMGTQGNIDSIIKVSPQVLIGVPSYIYHLARLALEQKKDFSFIRKVILGASAVPLGFKEKLSGLFSKMGAKEVFILGTYGFTEAKCAWGECPAESGASSGYHTNPDKEIFELIDPKSGQVKKEGEDGELVYTALDARGSAVVRYRTGDLVKGGIAYGPCPYCARTVPRIASLIYRASNIKELRLSKVKGTLVNLNMFAAIFEEEKAVEEWQIEIRKKDNDPYEVDELIIYLSLTIGIDQPELKKRLTNKILSLTEVTPNEIIILSQSQMLNQVEMEISHKVKRFVDKRL